LDTLQRFGMLHNSTREGIYLELGIATLYATIAAKIWEIFQPKILSSPSSIRSLDPAVQLLEIVLNIMQLASDSNNGMSSRTTDYSLSPSTNMIS
jgi:hypothetical protein